MTTSTKKPAQPAPTTVPTLLTPEAVAEILGLALGTLANWRAERPNPGPPFVKVGRTVRYAEPDLAAWIASRTYVK